MSREDAEGWEALYEDVVTSDLPDPELLARYATAPNALSEAERLEVERAMRDSPAVVDEVETLRRFDFSRLDEDLRAAEATGGIGARLAWLSPARLATAAALAALLTLSIVVFQARDAEREGQRVQIVKQPGSETPPLGNDPVEPAPKRPTVVERERPPTTRLADGGLETGSEDPPTSPVPDLTRERAEPTPERSLADRDPTAAPAPPPLVTPGAPDAPPSAPREMLLAMNVPVYTRPIDAAARAFDGRTRAGGEAPKITPLAPLHVARSATRQPALHWDIDRVPADGDFYLSISDAHAEDLVENRALPAVERAGIQRTALSDLDVSLEPGVEYRWSIALRSDAEAPPTRFAFGWIRVVEPDAALRARLAAADAIERPDRYARAGYWYDALDAAIELIGIHPDADEPKAALAALLEQGSVALDTD